MDETLKKSGEWPNVALVPGTHTHAATGEHVEQPEWTRADWMQPAKDVRVVFYDGKMAIEAIGGKES